MSARVAIWLSLLCVAVALTIAAVDAASPKGNNGNHNGWYKVKLDRDFTKGTQPFNGKGHKFPHKLPLDPRTGMVYTGPANRSAEWRALTAQLKVNAAAIALWTDRPLPAAVQNVLLDGTVADSIDNQTTVTTNSTCNRGGHHCQQVLSQAKNNMAREQVRIASHRVVEHGDRREHVLELSATTGTCGVNASISFTPDATLFSLLFNNFNVHTSKLNGQLLLQQSINCAFRVPITVPTGLTVAALGSQLRGFASSSPQGQAGIAWSAGIGLDIDPAAWADIYDEASYSARYWSGGVSSGLDFDPITVAMELDATNPTFSPCSACGGNCPKSFDVPVDFHFVLTAVRNATEAQGPHPAESFVFLDSQDTVKSIALNQPFAIETC